MRTINGKLIEQGHNELDAMKQQTKDIIQYCKHLESQLQAVSTQKDTRCLQEIVTVKDSLRQLNQRLVFLSHDRSNKSKKVWYLNIGTFIGLICLWFWLGINNQPIHQEVKPKKHTQSLQLDTKLTNQIIK